MPADSVTLESPTGDEWAPVVRLVLGGIGDRLDLDLDQLDDLQLAVERLLAEARSQPHVRMTFEMGEGSVRTRIGPLPAPAIADALQGSASPGEELGLRRVLETVVDSFGVEEAGGGVVVRLEKSIAPGPA